MKYEGKLYGHVGGRKYLPLCMDSNDVEKLQEDNDKLLQLLKESYVFIAMRHKAHDPWRIALDKWQERVEDLTEWDALSKIEEINNARIHMVQQ